VLCLFNNSHSSSHTPHRARPSRTLARKARPSRLKKLRSDAAVLARRKESAPFADNGGISPLGDVNELIPRSIAPAEAVRLLAGVLVNLVDSGDMAAVRELMKHELFSSIALFEVVRYARLSGDETPLLDIVDLETRVRDAMRGHDELQARIDQMHCESRERAEAVRERNRKKIAPAQAKRASDAKNTKIVAELNRRKRSGEDFQGRSVCSVLGSRFDVSADHVRKIRKKWNSGFKSPKRD